MVDGLVTVFKIPVVTTRGNYTIFSQFPKGTYSGRYLTTNLQTGASSVSKGAVRAFNLKWLRPAGTALKYAGWVMVGVTAAISGVEEYYRNPYLPESRKVLNTTGAVAVDLAQSATAWGAAAVGAKGGTAIGTLICPGIGTVVGGIIGGLFGGLVVGLGGNAIKNSIAENNRNRRYNELFGD